jgi:5-formyltetrahydrofolate cyclo-ligase
VVISELDVEKKELRTWARRQRAEFLSSDDVALAEQRAKLIAAFSSIVVARKWKHIGVFIPLPGEPDIWTPAQQLSQDFNVNVYAPRMMPENQLDLVMVTAPNELVRGRFGVIQPPPNWDALTDLALLNAIFIPGLAFSHGGSRLGFGGGWYDRLLAKIPDKVVKIGVCWNNMVVDSIPMDTWDVSVDGILTEVGFSTTNLMTFGGVHK